jgi:hypothetical protein
MRRTIQEPGFWLMVFGTVIIAMFLFASNGDCAEDDIIRVSYNYGPLTYSIEVKPDCPESGCRDTFYHFIGQTGENLALVGITHRMPNAEVLQIMMYKYMMVITQGGM